TFYHYLNILRIFNIKNRVICLRILQYIESFDVNTPNKSGACLCRAWLVASARKRFALFGARVKVTARVGGWRLGLDATLSDRCTGNRAAYRGHSDGHGLHYLAVRQSRPEQHCHLREEHAQGEGNGTTESHQSCAFLHPADL